MKHRILFFTVLTFVGIGASASAGTFTFNFNTLPGSSSGANSTNNSAAIQAYMDGVLTAAGCTGCSVTVTGAVSDKSYNGEGYVVGPNGNAVTLGNTNGATGNNATPGSTDTFIANTADNSSFVSSEITMVFSGLTVANASFDYEIFPDGTCSSLSNCGGAGHPNLPDFEFTTGSGAGTPVTTFGTSGVQYGVVPGSGDGKETRSSKDNPELAPQYIGVSGTLALGAGVTELNFVDWPATIGIDNLVITTPPSVPEPSSMLLLGTACLGVFLSLRRRFSKLS